MAAIFLKLGIALASALFGAAVIALGVARLAIHDPLERYTSIMPGQSIDAVRNYDCLLQVGTVKNIEMGFCQFPPGDGVFDRIAVIESNRVITQTSFVVQPDQLRLGDLVLCWGKPIDVGYHIPGDVGYSDLYWGDRYTARLADAHVGTALNYALPISALSIMYEWRSCRSME